MIFICVFVYIALASESKTKDKTNSNLGNDTISDVLVGVNSDEGQAFLHFAEISFEQL